MAHTRTWTSAAIEINPEDADEAKYGAQEIRNLRVDVRERLALEHYFPVTGTYAANSQGQHKRTFRDVLSATTDTVLVTDDVVRYGSTSAVTVTIPEYNDSTPDTFTGHMITLQKAGDSGLITINRSGSDNFNGVTSLYLSTKYQYVTIINTGTPTWWVIGGWSGWISAGSLGSGWSAATTMSYGKGADGTIWLQGQATRASLATTALYTLPAGYRPLQQLYVPGAYSELNVSTDIYYPQLISITTSGVISPLIDSVGIILDGISFKAETNV